ncbi:MAG: hypothetical protein BM557_01480 [Flavobacterium sp. MedPE-SWcel]|uniref:hypothetical protein n=1 Tax=uncultured Flavobacterium sp. TaxID=165435 RepID=UPI00090EC3C5|nr:hypothetical protein [uncultured Flavobacterium sp.]OIQ22076.1 MAG: hypothetical protein BM557_01480 [Flavobacterium sp. MedPE-SWcel]
MKLKLLLQFLLLAFILQGCMYSGTETITNNNITPELRETIHIKNDSLLDALSNSNMKSFKALGSPDFVKHLQSRINNIVWAYRKGYLKTEYTVYNEYYNKHSKAPNNSKIESEEGEFTFIYGNNSKETYVSLLKTSYAGIADYLITVIYELIDNQWKLNYVHIDPLGQYNKNAQQYFEIAKKKEKEGYIIDAYINCDIAENCLTPAGEMLKYDNEDKILFYHKTWREQINNEYPFPQHLKAISSSPTVMKFEPVKNREGMFPLFTYDTQIPITDTVLLKMEFEEVKREIRQLYKGLDFNKKYIYYRVYHEDNNRDYHEFKEVK